ncbi:MAG: DUF1015 domain-containing protein [Clostridia bacterium]|nr:DUF1015 domain-containing protein [Clostridia bacterium]
MSNRTLIPAEILLPSGCDLPKWSVVACDQYTSEPEYWRQTEEFVGGSPSTLRLTLPEAYLESPDAGKRIDQIGCTMQKYLDDGILGSAGRGFVYLERTLRSGAIRRGLIGAVDLEQYDFRSGSQSPIRATEGTVLERIPPRVRVRRGAALEVPHIMLLIDDAGQTVIEPLVAAKKRFRPLYDFELMQQSGRAAGYMVDKAGESAALSALDALADQKSFEAKYGVSDKGVLLFAAGDGNHSLATAKECFEQIKATLPEEQWKNHPARYALVEVVNLHDAALDFEPIHRVVFGADEGRLLAALEKFCGACLEPCGPQTFACVTRQTERQIWVKSPSSNLAVGTLQAFLDRYTAENGGRVDYIHGEEVVRSLCADNGNIGFLLPPMPKNELFRTVILDGALPRKTFSMGHACDKRFYLECRKIS